MLDLLRLVSSQSYLLQETYSIKYQDYRSKSPQYVPYTSQLQSKCSGSFFHLKIPLSLMATPPMQPLSSWQGKRHCGL